MVGSLRYAGMCFKWGALLPLASGLSCCKSARSPACNDVNNQNGSPFKAVCDDGYIHAVEWKWCQCLLRVVCAFIVLQVRGIIT